MTTTSRHPGNVYARERDNVAALELAYPHQFPEPSWAYSWPDGWHRLVAEACAGLARLRPDGYWRQIKEKFGGLRLYYSGGPQRLDMQTPGGVYCMSVHAGGEATELDLLIAQLENWRGRAVKPAACAQACAVSAARFGSAAGGSRPAKPASR